MPKCSQCDRPALYAIGPEQVPLCLQCAAIHQNIFDKQLDALERQADRAFEDMQAVAGVRLRPPRPPRPVPIVVQGATFNNINVNNSNVGIINTGQLHQVDTAVSVIAQHGEPQLANALKMLTDAVLASTTMNATQQKEAVEILSAVSTEATQEKAQRRTGVVRPLLQRLKELVTSASDLVSIVKTAWPLIASAFGIS